MAFDWLSTPPANEQVCPPQFDRSERTYAGECLFDAFRHGDLRRIEAIAIELWWPRELAIVEGLIEAFDEACKGHGDSRAAIESVVHRNMN